METPIELLLTDEYVNFSTKLAEIHFERKELKEAWKKKHEEFQANLKALEKRAWDAVGEWDEWKNTKLKNPSPVRVEKAEKAS